MTPLDPRFANAVTSYGDPHVRSIEALATWMATRYSLTELETFERNGVLATGFRSPAPVSPHDRDIAIESALRIKRDWIDRGQALGDVPGLTAGPWAIREQSQSHLESGEITMTWTVAANGQPLASTYPGFGRNPENVWAMAAAPDLLEACRQLVACVAFADSVTPADLKSSGTLAAVRIAQAAILRAETGIGPDGEAFSIKLTDRFSPTVLHPTQLS